MRKIRLDAGELAVESFTVEGGSHAHGTVLAHNTGWCGTQYGTCQDSCADTCAGPTCEPPCVYDGTQYLTCMEGCYWATGDPCVAAIG